jgi:putative AlgH/UPF0301 family transcriptional regulator
MKWLNLNREVQQKHWSTSPKQPNMLLNPARFARWTALLAQGCRLA